MNDERHYSNHAVVSAPLGRDRGGCAGDRFGGGTGRAAGMASNRSSALEQNQATQGQQLRQQEDVLGQRLAKAEDTNAQLRGEINLVTGKMKLTRR